MTSSYSLHEQAKG